MGFWAGRGSALCRGTQPAVGTVWRPSRYAALRSATESGAPPRIETHSRRDGLRAGRLAGSVQCGAAPPLSGDELPGFDQTEIRRIGSRPRRSCLSEERRAGRESRHRVRKARRSTRSIRRWNQRGRRGSTREGAARGGGDHGPCGPSGCGGGYAVWDRPDGTRTAGTRGGT